MAVDNYHKHQRLHTKQSSSNHLRTLVGPSLAEIWLSDSLSTLSWAEPSSNKNTAAPCVVASNEVKLDQ